MIDLFAIFGKGGIVLWCFQGTSQALSSSVNALIKSVFLEERSNTSAFQHNGHILKYKLDNEFDLVFVVVYSNVVQLAYTDKLLSDVHLEFRDKYRQVLADPRALYSLGGKGHFEAFGKVFNKLMKIAQEEASKSVATKTMRGFESSEKSQKTVASMIIQPGAGSKGAKASIPVNKPKKQTTAANVDSDAGGKGKEKGGKGAKGAVGKEENDAESLLSEEKEASKQNGEAELTEIEKNRLNFMKKMQGGGKPKASPKPKAPEGGKPGKKVKVARKWQEEFKAEDLDFSKAKSGGDQAAQANGHDDSGLEFRTDLVGSMKGGIQDIDAEEESSEEEEEEEPQLASAGKSSSGGGLFSAFKSLVGSKKLTLEDIQPALDKMKDHLIGKNVAAEIAEKLCQSVATQLEGKVIGTWSGVAGTVKETLRESLIQLLSPRRRVDILRDIAEAKSQRRPYTVVFCGVNGVGKSTNLSKITFWLTENGYRVMIAACDTFRAGAVEQLRTHTRHLNALHPNSVSLYDQGYGKDAAGVAAQAIDQATKQGIDVVLVDTAGRMQDNEPLMRALSKLIKENKPDLVLFVGEALVGNEAVDQLVKFNQALADHATPGLTPRLIDGIVLTKFDTIDDKVGAAISMTYITGQPIVFVGTGQTYNDLKNLNANAVVNSLLK